FIASLVLQPEAILQMNGLFSILSPGQRALYQLGMTGGVAWREGWWWTVLTAIYLHGGLLHIFFNVMWIRSLGPQVEEVSAPAQAKGCSPKRESRGVQLLALALLALTGAGVVLSFIKVTSLLLIR